MRSPGPYGGDLLARRYRLIDQVGVGGMSVVWRARDEVLDRLVAVKWLGSELADDDVFRDLVRREAWATARIKHPAVAAVYDYGEVPAPDGSSRAYVVMEMLDGEPLAARIRRGPLPWREAVTIASAVADTLATAHDQGVVHRDLNPDNVMLTSSGPRVFDFGIAAPIGEPDDDATGSTFGTPAYVAPERLDGQPARTATDVYCLGVLLFEMLTGTTPFPEDAWDLEAPLRHRSAPRPKAPGLPSAVARLCQRCLAHEQSARPSARDAHQLLAAFTRPRWREPAFIAAGVVGVFAAAAVAVAYVPTGSITGLGAGPATSASTTNRLSTSDTLAATTASAGPSTTPTPTSSSSSASSVVPSTSQPSASSPTQTPTPTPSVTVVPVSQAIDSLRGVIDGAVPNGLASDIAVDLRNSVDDIARKEMADPNADVAPMVDALRTKVLTRSMEYDDKGQLRMTTATKDALLASISQLRTSVTLA